MVLSAASFLSALALNSAKYLHTIRNLQSFSSHIQTDDSTAQPNIEADSSNL
jgi:hypothetical protein